MDWEKAATGDSDYERIPEGYCQAEVKKAYRANKDGKPYESAKGSYVRLLVEDAKGRTASCSLWITEKAAWKLAATLQRIGHDMKDLTDKGVEISHFLNEETCKRAFVGRSCWWQVEHSGNYANADAVSLGDVPPQLLQQSVAPSEAVDDDSVPF